MMRVVDEPCAVPQLACLRGCVWRALRDADDGYVDSGCGGVCFEQRDSVQDGVGAAIVGFGKAGLEAVAGVDASGVDAVECAVEECGGHG